MESILLAPCHHAGFMFSHAPLTGQPRTTGFGLYRRAKAGNICLYQACECLNRTMTEIKLTTSSEAEEAFYAAFSRGDLQAMQELWLPSETTSCIHPMGDRLLGTAAIIKSWETILRNTGDIIVETSDRVIHGDEQIALHTLVENIHSLDKPEQIFRFVVTNIYQNTGLDWKMILHHASPMPHDTSQKDSPSTVVH